MTLFCPDKGLREVFDKLVDKLLSGVDVSAEDVFLHAIESEADAQMNYWVVRLLIERQSVDPLLPLSHDAMGEAITPLHAACLLKNPGALAALLDLNTYESSPLGRQYLSAIRLCQAKDFEHGAALMMAHAQDNNLLDALLMTLQGIKPH